MYIHNSFSTNPANFLQQLLIYLLFSRQINKSFYNFLFQGSHEIGGRHIDVKKAVSREDMGGSGGGGRGGRGGRGGGGRVIIN